MNLVYANTNSTLLSAIKNIVETFEEFTLYECETNEFAIRQCKKIPDLDLLILDTNCKSVNLEYAGKLLSSSYSATTVFLVGSNFDNKLILSMREFEIKDFIVDKNLATELPKKINMFLGIEDDEPEALETIPELEDKPSSEASKDSPKEEIPIDEANVLKNFIDKLPDLVYFTDAKGIIMYINKTIEQYGYKQKDLLGRPIFSIAYQKDIDKLFAIISRFKDGEDSVINTKLQLRTKNKTLKHFDLKSQPTNINPSILQEMMGVSGEASSNKEIQGIYGVARDMTLETILNEKAKAKDNVLINVFKQSQDAIILWEILADYSIVCAEINDAACTLMGYVKAELLNKPITFFLSDKSVNTYNNFTDAMKISNKIKLLSEYKTKSDQIIQIESSRSLMNIDDRNYVIAIIKQKLLTFDQI